MVCACLTTRITDSAELRRIHSAASGQHKPFKAAILRRDCRLMLTSRPLVQLWRGDPSRSQHASPRTASIKHQWHVRLPLAASVPQRRSATTVHRMLCPSAASCSAAPSTSPFTLRDAKPSQHGYHMFGRACQDLFYSLLYFTVLILHLSRSNRLRCNNVIIEERSIIAHCRTIVH